MSYRARCWTSTSTSTTSSPTSRTATGLPASAATAPSPEPEIPFPRTRSKLKANLFWSKSLEFYAFSMRAKLVTASHVERLFDHQLQSTLDDAGDVRSGPGIVRCFAKAGHTRRHAAGVHVQDHRRKRYAPALFGNDEMSAVSFSKGIQCNVGTLSKSRSKLQVQSTLLSGLRFVILWLFAERERQEIDRDVQLNMFWCRTDDVPSWSQWWVPRCGVGQRLHSLPGERWIRGSDAGRQDQQKGTSSVELAWTCIFHKNIGTKWCGPSKYSGYCGILIGLFRNPTHFKQNSKTSSVSTTKKRPVSFENCAIQKIRIKRGRLYQIQLWYVKTFWPRDF